jgi:hypothetical protein
MSPALADVVFAGRLCAWFSPTTDVDLREVTQPTRLTTTVAQAKITSVTISSSCGNPDLDRRLIDCVKEVPDALIGTLKDMQQFDLLNDWKTANQSLPIPRNFRPASPTSTLTFNSSLARNADRQASAGIPGTATELAFMITPEGTVTNPTDTTSSGSSNLDNAAITCVTQ